MPLAEPPQSFQSSSPQDKKRLHPHLACCDFSAHIVYIVSMFGRINQLVRHLSRPLPNFAHTSAATASKSIVSPAAALGYNMTSSTTFSQNKTKTIHTAACLIIGDEVLGGKVHIIGSSKKELTEW
jgi:hypothetical protein